MFDQDIVAAMAMYPAPMNPEQHWSAAPQPAHVLAAVGDIQATATHLITPSGTVPLSTVNIYAMDQTHTTSKTPTWAIVAAVVTFWFALLGLLFLLVKEAKTEGYILLTVDGPGMRHVSQVPVFTAEQRADVMQRAAYLQMLAGQARTAR